MSAARPGDPEYVARYTAGYVAQARALQEWAWNAPEMPQPDELEVRDWRRYLTPIGCPCGCQEDVF